jgi:S1-C subfamily serine protease
MNKRTISQVLVIALLAASAAACATATATPTPTIAPTPEAAPTPPEAVPAPTAPPVYDQVAPGTVPSLLVSNPPPTSVFGRAANELETQIEAAYASTAPSVVNITTQLVGYSFFMQPVPEQGTGSGFIYDTTGHIVTNYHVIQDAQSIVVALTNGTSYTATVTGQDPSTDLAVLSVPADNLPPPLALEDSSQLRVGEFVLAIGSPFALQSTLTMGIISALQRLIQSPDGTVIAQAIQTDAAINPGNSGGPLLNLDGAVVGVNSQIIGATGASVGIGFAIASNTVSKVVPVLITSGTYPHPTLGLDGLDITADTASVLRQAGMSVPVDQGLLVTDVVAGGPAAAAGIRGAQHTVYIGRTAVGIGGDIITAIDDEPINGAEDLSLFLETKANIGDKVQVTLYRDGKQMTVSATLGERVQPTPTP